VLTLLDLRSSGRTHTRAIEPGSHRVQPDHTPTRR
jgi:hypothetical protein